MPQGTATIDFGSGQFVTSVEVTGQTDILSGSLVEAWLFPIATADHSADEHVAEGPNIRVIAAGPAAGVGFTIHAYAMSPPEPLAMPGEDRLRHVASSTAGQNTSRSTPIIGSDGGRMVLLTGLWTVAWCWSSGTGVPGGLTLLGSTTLGAAASSITVSSLTPTPSKSLRLLLQGTVSNGSAGATLQVNGSSLQQYCHINSDGGFDNNYNGYIAYLANTNANTPVFGEWFCDRPETGAYRLFQGLTAFCTVFPTVYGSEGHSGYTDTATPITSIGLTSLVSFFDSGCILSVWQFP